MDVKRNKNMIPPSFSEKSAFFHSLPHFHSVVREKTVLQCSQHSDVVNLADQKANASHGSSRYRFDLSIRPCSFVRLCVLSTEFIVFIWCFDDVQVCILCAYRSFPWRTGRVAYVWNSTDWSFCLACWWLCLFLLAKRFLSKFLANSCMCFVSSWEHLKLGRTFIASCIPKLKYLIASDAPLHSTKTRRSGSKIAEFPCKRPFRTFDRIHWLEQ